MRMRVAACGAGLALAILAGCSSGGDDDPAASPTTVATGGGAGVTTTLRPVDTSFTGQGSAEFCRLAQTYSTRSTVTGQSTPAQLRAQATEGKTAIAQAVNAAPAEIKADVQTLSTVYGAFVTELEKLNYDATKLTAASLAPLQAPEFGRASQRFTVYVRDVCKITG